MSGNTIKGLTALTHDTYVASVPGPTPEMKAYQSIAELQKEVEARDMIIETLRAAVKERGARIEALKKDYSDLCTEMMVKNSQVREEIQTIMNELHEVKGFV